MSPAHGTVTLGPSGYEARCVDCARVLSVGPDERAMRQWLARHLTLAHPDPPIDAKDGSQ